MSAHRDRDWPDNEGELTLLHRFLNAVGAFLLTILIIGIIILAVGAS